MKPSWTGIHPRPVPGSSQEPEFVRVCIIYVEPVRLAISKVQKETCLALKSRFCILIAEVSHLNLKDLN